MIIRTEKKKSWQNVKQYQMWLGKKVLKLLKVSSLTPFRIRSFWSQYTHTCTCPVVRDYSAYSFKKAILPQSVLLHFIGRDVGHVIITLCVSSVPEERLDKVI